MLEEILFEDDKLGHCRVSINYDNFEFLYNCLRSDGFLEEKRDFGEIKYILIRKSPRTFIIYDVNTFILESNYKMLDGDKIVRKIKFKQLTS